MRNIIAHVIAFYAALIGFEYKKQGGLHFIKTRWFGCSFYRVKPKVRKSREIKCETTSHFSLGWQIREWQEARKFAAETERMRLANAERICKINFIPRDAKFDDSYAALRTVRTTFGRA